MKKTFLTNSVHTDKELKVLNMSAMKQTGSSLVSSSCSSPFFFFARRSSSGFGHLDHEPNNERQGGFITVILDPDMAPPNLPASSNIALEVTTWCALTNYLCMLGHWLHVLPRRHVRATGTMFTSSVGAVSRSRGKLSRPPTALKHERTTESASLGALLHIARIKDCKVEVRLHFVKHSISDAPGLASRMTS